MKNNKFLFLLFVIMASCNSNNQLDLQKALSLSGENRSELEKVLSHYQDDSLKYKATVFLIENMPYHSYNSDTKHDYYFMAGDNVVNSHDSRYWGLLPDEFIVGKVWLIW